MSARARSTVRYRPEIDGLRGVAVVSVALFHAGLGPSGGFVGVDVFFVISGYVITATLLADLEARRFSLVGFYERRARRLLPALLVVIAACTPLAYRWMLPNDLSSYGQSMVATSLFLNNALLLHTSGYWALPTPFKPLLHTWSLGIEEQYYVLFPLLILVGWRFSRRRLAAGLVALAALSLATAQWLSAVDPDAAFYLAPTRAWEFLAGSLVALRVKPRRSRPAPGALRIDGAVGRAGAGTPGRTRSSVARRLMSPHVPGVVGLTMLALSILGLAGPMRTPGLSMLLPVVGTALVLTSATEGTVAFRLLAHRVPVGLGLISYSLYLWHQPLLAFARIGSVEPPAPAIMAVLLGLAVPLAYLSWRFVERPLRAPGTVGRTAFVYASILLTAGCVGCGSFLYLARGLPGRLYPGDVVVDDLYIGYNDRVFGSKHDAFVRPDARHVLVVGNSFARDFVNMVTETLDLDGVELVYRDDLGGCLATWTKPLARSLLEDAAVIVLASRTLEHRCVGDDIARADAQGKRLFYVGGKHFGANLNWLMRLAPEARNERFNPLLPDMIRKEEIDTAAIPHAHFLSILAPIVRDGRIPITDERGRLLGTPDRTHLTRYGASYVGARILPGSAFADALRGPP